MKSRGVRRFDRGIDDFRVEAEMNNLMPLVDVLEEKGVLKGSEGSRGSKKGSLQSKG